MQKGLYTGLGFTGFRVRRFIGCRAPGSPWFRVWGMAAVGVGIHGLGIGDGGV